ncbi:MAG: RIP metalloprotease RseP [Clostridia bacterium]
MISLIITILKIIFILGFLVLIHEGGHFLTAKLCKVKVNEFAIGFGPTIWKKQGKETKYALRLIPLGGFVNMEGEEERSDKEGSFSKASIPKRIAIVAAGGLTNIIFALIVYFALMGFTGNNTSNIIEGVIPNTNAEVVGIQPGDKILKVDGKKINYKNDLDEALKKCEGNPIEVVVERNGKQENFIIKPVEEKYNYTGIAIDGSGETNTKIAAVYPKSPAEMQGLEIGDTILKINETEVAGNAKKLVEEINKTINDVIEFTIERNGEILKILVTPEVRENYYIGVYLQKAENNFANNIYYAFFETGNFAFSIVDNLKMLFTGNVSVNQMMGPVGIGEVVAKTNGFADFIYILALISISLGFTNLLPFPPLDGGKIVIFIIEAIRRKPISEKLEIYIQMIGFALLIGLSILVTYNDILRIF